MPLWVRAGTLVRKAPRRIADWGGGPRLCLGSAPAEVWKLALVSAAQNTEAQVLLKEEKEGPDRLVYLGATVLSRTPYTPPPLPGG